MKKLKLFIATLAAKAVFFICSVLKSRGSTAPGNIALKICPDFIDLMAKQIKEKIIIVCGTNGKTTTNNLINSVLLKAGNKIVCNNVGANMLGGIAASFAKKAKFFGKLDADFATLEVDEANLHLLFRHLTPDVITVTNLFRDQLDRYGEIEGTSKLLKKAFLLAPHAQLVLNADDPVTSVFETKKENIYYCIGQKTDLITLRERHYGSECPKCSTLMDYEYYNYGQLGKYKCQKCGYKNPDSVYSATNIKIEDGTLRFDINKLSKKSFRLTSHVTGLYNVYNLLGAYSVLNSIGINEDTIKNVLSNQKPEPGRMSKFNIGDKEIYIVLSKNPTGFNQSVTAVINDPRAKDVCILLNDNPSDGVDISWIYDVDFETLCESKTSSYTFGGIRKHDMYLRLKYAGADESVMKIAENIEEAISLMLLGGEKVCYALVNYTTMHPAYLVLKGLSEKGDKE